MFWKPKKEPQVFIRVFQSEYFAMMEEAKKYRNRETGGDLFGSFTHGNLPIIWLATGPGPLAKRSTAEFEQDSQFRTEWQNRLSKDYGIQFLGAWHSHHQLGIDHPSSGDIGASESYLRRHNRSVVVEIIAIHERSGETVLHPYYYTLGGTWQLGEFEFLQGNSPIRDKLQSELRRNSEGSLYEYETERIGRFSESDQEIRQTNNMYPMEGKTSEDAPSNFLSPTIQKQDDLVTPRLTRELSELGFDVEVDKRGNRTMLILPLGDNRFGASQFSLAIVVEDLPYITKIYQANIISSVLGINQDVTEDLLNGQVLENRGDFYAGSIMNIYSFSKEITKRSRRY